MSNFFSGDIPVGAITISVDPTIARLGHVHIGWYGLAVTLAIGAGLWLTQREAKQRGLPEAAVWATALWAVAGGFAGARLLHVVDRWTDYSGDPLGIFAFQRGGIAIEGAIIGGAVAGLLAAKINSISPLSLADAAAPGAILGQAIGRLGCLVTGDALGGPTNLPWGLVYTNPGSMAPSMGVAYQPVFAYEAAWDILVLLVLWPLRQRLPQPGSLFGSYLALYAVGKFGITFLRQERIWALGLQEAHFLAFMLFVVGVALVLPRRGPPGGVRGMRAGTT